MNDDQIELRVSNKGRMGQGTVLHQELRLFIQHPERPTIHVGTVCATERRILMLCHIVETGCRILNIPCSSTSPLPTRS